MPIGLKKYMGLVLQRYSRIKGKAVMASAKKISTLETFFLFTNFAKNAELLKRALQTLQVVQLPLRHKASVWMHR